MSPLKVSPDVKRKKIKARVRPKKIKDNATENTEGSFEEYETSSILDGDVYRGTPLEPINEAEDDHSPNINRNQRPRLHILNQDLLSIQIIPKDDNLSYNKTVDKE